ncbi:hypothetical protein [Bosea sp. BK604]|uniref:hypothetical protein n=1 Tax=Bosea sp. BK604 TaxID=2512180 RepID=UPI0024A61DD5|nr:hypothetical protein [Bosea sp. BK604]
MLDQYFKPWPVCRWAQPAIEAASRLLSEQVFEASEIDYVEVETFHEAVRLGVQLPMTTEAAQYAIGFPLAAYIVRGRLGADEIDADGLGDPAIRDMLSRIRLVESPEFSRRFPAERLARLRIVLKSGQIASCEAITTRGDRGRPLSDADMLAKFRSSAAVLGSERSTTLGENCMAVAKPCKLELVSNCLFAPI